VIVTLAFLVVEPPYIKGRAWFVSEARIIIDHEPVYVPMFDDEKSKQVTLDFALDARARWRHYCQRTFKSDLHIVLEKYGPFIDEHRLAPSTGQDSRQPEFVVFDNTNPPGLGLIVVPGNRPEGPCWFVRAVDIPAFAAEGRHTVIESVVGATPQEAAQRAFDTYGSHILFGDPDADAREEKERQEKLKQANSLPPGVIPRPGNRR